MWLLMSRKQEMPEARKEEQVQESTRQVSVSSQR